MILITLLSHPRSGTIQINDTRHELATWHRAGPGLMLATTTDGQRVTLATEDEGGVIRGSITIGNTLDAPRWDIWDGQREGATLRGWAALAVPDGWLEGYVERLAGRVKG